MWFTGAKASACEPPPNGDREIILDSKSLNNVKCEIERVFDFWKKRYPCGQPSDIDIHNIINTLSPNFHILPTCRDKFSATEQQFIKLTQQQIEILDSLEEQEEAVICGSAGTGKTLVALEKARRLAEKGENILFLCFNSALKNFLKKNNTNESISFETFHTLAAKHIKHGNTSYDETARKFLTRLAENDSPLGYDSIIIDEGQDLENEWIKCIKTKFTSNFYIFYDHLQNVFRGEIPRVILESSCKLTLKKNCRNTFEIAHTAYVAINAPVVLPSNHPKGSKPKLFEYADSQELKGKVANALDAHLSAGGLNPNDIVILTVETEKTSAIGKYFIEEYYKLLDKNNGDTTLFTTARKFKGLEANIIYLVDVNLDKAEDREWAKRFYIGCSRAKHELHIFFTQINESSLTKAIKAFGGADNTVPSKESLAELLHAEWA